MGLDLSFHAQNDVCDLRLSQVDWDILAIAGKLCPGEMDVIAGVDDFGAPRLVKGLEFLKAVETVLAMLEREKDKLPYVYGFKIVEGLAAGTSGSGMTTGIRIDGERFWYSLQAGLGRCILEKLTQTPDGKVVVLETRDVRDLKTLKTENAGEIKIYRKKTSTHLKENFVRLRDFATRHTDEDVRKILG
jgi:hypothetical protein